MDINKFVLFWQQLLDSHWLFFSLLHHLGPAWLPANLDQVQTKFVPLFALKWQTCRVKRFLWIVKLNYSTRKWSASLQFWFFLSDLHHYQGIGKYIGINWTLIYIPLILFNHKYQYYQESNNNSTGNLIGCGLPVGYYLSKQRYHIIISNKFWKYFMIVYFLFFL